MDICAYQFFEMHNAYITTHFDIDGNTQVRRIYSQGQNTEMQKYKNAKNTKIHKYNQDCEYDSLAVTSKMGSEEARNHGLYCGNKLPPVSAVVVPMVMVMVMVMVT